MSQQVLQECLKICSDIHDAQKMNHAYFDEPLTSNTINRLTFVGFSEMSRKLMDKLNLGQTFHVLPRINFVFGGPLTFLLAPSSGQKFKFDPVFGL